MAVTEAQCSIYQSELNTLRGQTLKAARSKRGRG
jgi:hypothetical protein